MSKIKTVIAFSLLACFALSIMPAMALDVGLYYGSYTGLGSQDVRQGIMSIIQYLMGFLGVVAIVIVLYGGFTWMTAGGNEEKVGQAKKIISAGVIGLIIIFVSYSLASFVVNQLMYATGAATAP